MDTSESEYIHYSQDSDYSQSAATMADGHSDSSHLYCDDPSDGGYDQDAHQSSQDTHYNSVSDSTPQTANTDYSTLGGVIGGVAGEAAGAAFGPLGTAAGAYGGHEVGSYAGESPDNLEHVAKVTDEVGLGIGTAALISGQEELEPAALALHWASNAEEGLAEEWRQSEQQN
jgi:hypothetical protein